MKARPHESGQKTSEVESVGSALALHPFVTKTVTNSDGESRGTEGNEITNFEVFRGVQVN
jgi:hypothetical protein